MNRRRFPGMSILAARKPIGLETRLRIPPGRSMAQPIAADQDDQDSSAELLADVGAAENDDDVADGS